ncbi:MAG: hypothetical protein AAB071_07525 [Bacteroidota bacterium]
MKLILFFFRIKKTLQHPPQQTRQQSESSKHPFSAGEIKDATFEDIK